MITAPPRVGQLKKLEVNRPINPATSQLSHSPQKSYTQSQFAPLSPGASLHQAFAGLISVTAEGGRDGQAEPDHRR
jgi:hypothetical protein